MDKLRIELCGQPDRLDWTAVIRIIRCAVDREAGGKQTPRQGDGDGEDAQLDSVQKARMGGWPHVPST